MADLEKLLLEAAGRTGPSRRNRHSPPSPRRRRGGSYSDIGSDSEDSHDNRGYASRKSSTPHVSLKKRLDSSGRDDEHSSKEDGDDGFDRQGDSDDDSIGSDLYKDEDDRRKLAQMTELEREMILSERSTKITDKKMQQKLRKQKEKMNQSRKDSHPHISSRTSMRTSARSSDRATAKDDALNELRAKRMRQKDPDTHQRLGDITKGGSGSRRYSPVKRRSFPAKASSSSSQSGSGSQSEEESSGDDGIGDSEDDKSSQESTVPTYEDIKEITITRSKLAKWLMEPFFDDLIVGCFVRVGIGYTRERDRIYRLCVVKNVDSEYSDKQYTLDNKMTHKYLNCVWGNESSAARWKMIMVSDSPPLETEFHEWVKEVERSRGRMPSKQDVLDKKDAIQKSSTYVYSAATVKQMLQEKKSATWRPLNVAAEKDRLRKAMEVASGMNDGAEVERIKARLSELEASRQTQEKKDDKATKLAEMNRRNRVENFRNASGLKSATGLKAGDAGYDPFSRRWTRSRNYYVPKASGGSEAAVTENGDQTAELVRPDVGGVVATAAALEAAADAGKLVDTSAPVDQGTESNMLHNFELPISLAILQKFGGAQGAQAGFMARKQRIEATIGCQVPENDGRRHGLTLTVSDYKRRRGLL